MTKENIEIRAYIKNIESSLVGIGMELSTLLLRRDKVFKVTVGKRVFEFMPTTDEVEEENMADLISVLKDNKYVKVKSILSHMATSDALEHRDFALSQIDLFEKLSSKIISELQINPIRHILNTSGISNFSPVSSR